MNDERAADVEAWLAGREITYTEFARKHGISIARARQILLGAFHRATRDAMRMPQDARWLPDDWPLDKVPLPTRTSNALLREGLKTVGQLRENSGLPWIPNLGAASLQWLAHVTATEIAPRLTLPDKKLTARVERLQAENAGLRARLNRIIAAARKEAAND
jgi:hypothetical protein